MPRISRSIETEGRLVVAEARRREEREGRTGLLLGAMECSRTR
jgi:hypothetical protein